MKTNKHTKRLAQALLNLSPPKNAQEVGLHTYTSGAIYSYTRLIELEYDEAQWGHRDWQTRYAELTGNARKLSKGNLPRSGQGLAEYYYNNLIHRLDVAFEREWPVHAVTTGNGNDRIRSASVAPRRSIVKVGSRP